MRNFFSIRLKNYRQFEGEQSLDFPTLEDAKNVSVIVGVNGAGKSNLYNGIHWCLYGSEPTLSEKSKIKPKINQNTAIHEMSPGDEREIEVEVMIGEYSPEYCICRSARFRKDDKIESKDDLKDNMTQISENLSAYEIKEEGYNELEYPVDLVYGLLPDRIKNFFLFNGEKLNETFKKEEKSKTKEYIFQLTQISLLNRTIDHLRKSQRRLSNSAGDVGSDLEEAEEDLQEHEKKLEEKKREMEELKQKIQKTEKERDEIVEYLQEHSQDYVKSLGKRLKELKGEKREIRKKKEGLEDTRTEIVVNKLPLFYAKKPLGNFLEKTDKLEKDIGLPPKVRKPFLQDLLNAGECICKRNLKEGSEAREAVEKLRDESEVNELAAVASEGRYPVRNVLEKEAPQTIEQVQTISKKISDFREKMKKKSKEVSRIQGELSERPEEEIKTKSKRLEELRTKLPRARKRVGKLEDKVGGLGQSIEDKRTKVKNLRSKKIGNKEIRSKIEKLSKAEDFLVRIKDRIIGEVQETLEEEVEETFLEIIPGAFDRVEIDEDYGISVIDKQGVESFGSLSAGQRQGLAFAFTSTLEKLSGYNFPVLVDTPLGRIDKENRLAIANNLPRVLEGVQLVLLATDSEYSPVVHGALKSRLNKAWILDFSKSEMCTTIEEVDKNELKRRTT